MSDGDDDQPSQDGRQRQRSRSRDRAHPHAQAPQAPQAPKTQPMGIQEPVTVPDEDPAAVKQRGRPSRQQRCRSRERASPHVTPHAGQQPQPAAPPFEEQQIQPLAIQGADEESATVEPQSRVSDRSRSQQRRKSTGTEATETEEE